MCSQIGHALAVENFALGEVALRELQPLLQLQQLLVLFDELHAENVALVDHHLQVFLLSQLLLLRLRVQELLPRDISQSLMASCPCKSPPDLLLGLLLVLRDSPTYSEKSMSCFTNCVYF